MEVIKTENQSFTDLKHISTYLSTIEDFRFEWGKNVLISYQIFFL